MKTTKTIFLIITIIVISFLFFTNCDETLTPGGDTGTPGGDTGITDDSYEPDNTWNDGNSIQLGGSQERTLTAGDVD